MLGRGSGSVDTNDSSRAGPDQRLFLRLMEAITMANLKEHGWLGAGTGVLTYILMCRYYDRPFDFGEMLACAAVSTATAMVPDILEPALSPNHRNVAHS